MALLRTAPGAEAPLASHEGPRRSQSLDRSPPDPSGPKSFRDLTAHRRSLGWRSDPRWPFPRAAARFPDPVRTVPPVEPRRCSPAAFGPKPAGCLLATAAPSGDTSDTTCLSVTPKRGGLAGRLDLPTSRPRQLLAVPPPSRSPSAFPSVTAAPCGRRALPGCPAVVPKHASLTCRGPPAGLSASTVSHGLPAGPKSCRLAPRDRRFLGRPAGPACRSSAPKHGLVTCVSDLPVSLLRWFVSLAASVPKHVRRAGRDHRTLGGRAPRLAVR